jgi:hypothetical protein
VRIHLAPTYDDEGDPPKNELSKNVIVEGNDFQEPGPEETRPLVTNEPRWPQVLELQFDSLHPDDPPSGGVAGGTLQDKRWWAGGTNPSDPHYDKIMSFSNAFSVSWPIGRHQVSSQPPGQDRISVNYFAPSRDIASYIESVGYSTSDQTLAKFLELARANRRGAWNANFTAHAVNEYIRDGFQVA